MKKSRNDPPKENTPHAHARTQFALAFFIDIAFVHSLLFHRLRCLRRCSARIHSPNPLIALHRLRFRLHAFSSIGRQTPFLVRRLIILFFFYDCECQLKRTMGHVVVRSFSIFQHKTPSHAYVFLIENGCGRRERKTSTKCDCTREWMNRESEVENCNTWYSPGHVSKPDSHLLASKWYFAYLHRLRTSKWASEQAAS